MDSKLDKTKLELIQWLSSLEDISVIEKILHLRKQEKSDWWSQLSSTERRSVEKGIADADAGKLNSNSEARKIYGEWL